MRARAAACALALVIAISAAACGDSGEEPAAITVSGDPTKLTADERDALDRDETAIAGYCRARALSLTNPGKRPTVGQQARALEGVDAMLALAGQKPNAEVRPGVELSLYLGDFAENLEGSNCDPQIVTRLDEGLVQLEAAP